MLIFVTIMGSVSLYPKTKGGWIVLKPDQMLKGVLFLLCLCGLFSTVQAGVMSKEDLIQGIESYRKSIRNWKIEYDQSTRKHVSSEGEKNENSPDATVTRYHIVGTLDGEGRFFYSSMIRDIKDGNEVPVQRTDFSWDGKEYRYYLKQFEQMDPGQVNISKKLKSTPITGFRLLFGMMLWTYEFPLEKWGRQPASRQNPWLSDSLAALRFSGEKSDRGDLLGEVNITEETYNGSSVQRVDLLMAKNDKEGKEIPSIKKSRISSFWIDPQKSCLPVRVEEGDPMIRSTDLELVEMSKGFWFPKKIVYTEYSVMKPVVTTCFENITAEINRPTTDTDFCVEIPPGVQVFDITTDTPILIREGTSPMDIYNMQMLQKKMLEQPPQATPGK